MAAEKSSGILAEPPGEDGVDESVVLVMDGESPELAGAADASDSEESEEQKAEAAHNASNHEVRDGVEMKRCLTCQPEIAFKPLSAFHKDARSVDGLNKRCSDCVNKSAREYKAQRQERGEAPTSRGTRSNGHFGPGEDYQKAYARVLEYDEMEPVNIPQRKVRMDIDDETYVEFSAQGDLPKGVIVLIRDAVKAMQNYKLKKQNAFDFDF